MLWFDKRRIPPGKWPFLRTVHVGLRQLEESLLDSVDLTGGTGAITITGCLEAYRQAILRRVLDLSQSVAISWNTGQVIGSVVCARALLETLGTFHSLLSHAQKAADRKDWEALGRLVDSYALSTYGRLGRGTCKHQALPNVRKMVKQFIRDTKLGDEKFWDQICEVAHPNGEELMSYAGELNDRRFETHPSTFSERRLFQALHNCIYSCSWLIYAMLDFDILCEHIRTGRQPPHNHPLVQQKAQIEKIVHDCMEDDDLFRVP